MLKVYIAVCYFSLIIFSSVELTLFAMQKAPHELCLLLCRLLIPLYSLKIIDFIFYFFGDHEYCDLSNLCMNY